MKTIVLILVSIVPIFATGQSITEWNIKTDSLIQTLPGGANQFRFNEIVDNRKSYRLKAMFDTTFQVLRIQEMFDIATNKFDQSIEYFDSENAGVLSQEWNFQSIDSIKPRNYIMYLGCIIKDREPRRVKKWKRRIDRMAPVLDSYYIVDTILDRRTRAMKISLRFPVSGKRDLNVFYGPFGKSKRPQLESWFY